MVLEFSRIPNDLAQWAYDKYSFNVIPVMGQIVAGDRDSYQYLVESIRKFPDQETFASMIRTAGFDQVKYRNLTMGVAALHFGIAAVRPRRGGGGRAAPDAARPGLGGRPRL